jgi:hypothetical protein
LVLSELKHSGKKYLKSILPGILAELPILLIEDQVGAPLGIETDLYKTSDPVVLSGYIDVSELQDYDRLDIDVKLNMHWGTVRYQHHQISGHQEDPLLYVSDIVAPRGIHITAKMVNGASSRIIRYTWLKKK